MRQLIVDSVLDQLAHILAANKLKLAQHFPRSVDDVRRISKNATGAKYFAFKTSDWIL